MAASRPVGLGAKASVRRLRDMRDYATRDDCEYDDDVAELADAYQAYNDLPLAPVAMMETTRNTSMTTRTALPVPP